MVKYRISIWIALCCFAAGGVTGCKTDEDVGPRSAVDENVDGTDSSGDTDDSDSGVVLSGLNGAVQISAAINVNGIASDGSALFIGNNDGELQTMTVTGANASVLESFSSAINYVRLAQGVLAVQVYTELYMGEVTDGVSMISDDVHQFATLGGSAYWLRESDGALVTASADGGSTVTLNEETGANHYIMPIAAVGNTIFYASDTQLYAADAATGTAQQIYTAPEMIIEISANDDWLYFVGPWESISKMRHDGTDVTPLFTATSGFQPNLSELFLQGDNLYFLVKSKVGCAPTDIAQLNTSTDTVTLLLEGQDCIIGLTADDDAVYFGARKPTDTRGPLENGVYRLDL
ncbi:MAG: hypothetical protein JXX29_14485 [Deltaproteobacteria bacterium]|nr:hypothetical protein [Deltaproteobacteria bacterium]MBN2672887.1 hypothetical protein [Deltaproteobacteria bacterium]